MYAIHTCGTQEGIDNGEAYMLAYAKLLLGISDSVN